jgi:hypothetical protein
MTLCAANWFGEQTIAYGAHFELFYGILTNSLLFRTVLSLELLLLAVGKYGLRSTILRMPTHFRLFIIKVKYEYQSC